nr:uncharacterized protein LOC112075648 isoform X3 [Salvelinus alpinus]
MCSVIYTDHMLKTSCGPESYGSDHLKSASAPLMYRSFHISSICQSKKRNMSESPNTPCHTNTDNINPKEDVLPCTASKIDDTRIDTGQREKEDVLPCTGSSLAKTCPLNLMPGCWMSSKDQDRRNLKTSTAGPLYYWDRQVLGRVQVATQSWGEILFLNHIEVLYLLQKCVRKYSGKNKG